MCTRTQWLQERKTYLGGTDLAAIAGLNKYKTPLDVYLEKTTTKVQDEVTSQPARWGHKLEDVVAKEYEQRTGCSVELSDEVLRHPKYDFIGGNIDRWANGRRHILECKTAGFMMKKEWGEEGTDQIPENYLIQVAYYSAITGRDKVDLAVLIGGQEFKIFTYQKNEALEEKLVKIACNFWNKHIVAKMPPKAHTTEDLSALYPIAADKPIQASDEIAAKALMLKQLKTQEKQLAEKISSLQLEVQGFMKIQNPKYQEAVNNLTKILACN